MTSGPNLTRRTVLREGAVAFPAWWPARPRSAMLAGMASAATKHGYANVRVDDVIELARGSRRTFYAYFDGRESCLLEAHEMVLADCLRAVDEGPQELEAALGRLMRYLASWPAHAHLLLVEILAAGPTGVAAYETAMDTLARRLSACTIPGPKSSAVSADALAQARFGALHRLVQQRVLAGEHQALPRLTPALVELVTLRASD
ncbi:TetR/AcrR family transcriptional regulator [Baekduia sp.]|uniref:TetR/AcrR family transcriptional regulator n=1 Tax=Baekduia sp. TaxID=2600305 RepID=UPI002E0BC553|nr:TetR/AcrR family transcriptional regulator [Baekduia sp.]